MRPSKAFPGVSVVVGRELEFSRQNWNSWQVIVVAGGTSPAPAVGDYGLKFDVELSTVKGERVFV